MLLPRIAGWEAVGKRGRGVENGLARSLARPNPQGGSFRAERQTSAQAPVAA
jgi:hypothetical protein